MDEELQILQGIGAQKIYETTHIPIKYVQSILHGSFEGFSKVQFIGFISILEREYQQDLSELSRSGIRYFNEKKKQNINEGLFVVAEKQKGNKNLYLLIVIAIFLVVFLLKITLFSDKVSETYIDDTLIENVSKNIEPLASVVLEEKNVTLETNTSIDEVNTTVEEEIVELVEPKAIEKSFKIVSKSKVWFGYIDVKTNKHFQKIMRGEKTLDPSKTWLLLFGHGHINMYVNGELQKFSSRNKIRFIYKNNRLTPVTLREFKKLNKGRKW